MARPSKWLKALIKPKVAADVPLVIQLTDGHTGDAIQVLDSDGNELYKVDATGTVTPAGGMDVADTFTVHDPVDGTKKARLDAGGVTAGQTRVLAAPDYDGTLATQAGVETLTNKTLTAPKVSSGSHVGDTNGNELIKFPAAVANAVNELTISNAAADDAPEVAATGGDTHIGIRLKPKGAQGRVLATTRVLETMVASALNTASNLAYTAAQILGGLVLRDCNGGAREDTLPSAADLVADLPGAVAGMSFLFALRNSSGDAHTITVAAPGADVTLSGTMTVTQNNTKLFLVVLTNVGAATEAYTVYSLGTLVH